MIQKQYIEDLLFEKNWLKFKLKAINEQLKNKQYHDGSEFNHLVKLKNTTLVKIYNLLKEILR